MTILELLPKVADAIGVVAKDRQASMGGAGSFAFRGIDDLYNACHGAMVAHGVTLRPYLDEWESVDRERLKDGRPQGMSVHVRVWMSYEFLAADGTSLVVRVPGEALDTGDKATQKAMSSALKTCLIQTFTIPTEDVTKGDTQRTPEVGGRGAEGAPAPAGYDRPKRQRRLQSLFREVGIDDRPVRLEYARHATGHAEVGSVNDLTDDEVEIVIKDLEVTAKEFIAP